MSKLLTYTPTSAPAFTTDGFTAVADDAGLPDGAVIVSLKRFQAERESLLARNTPLGITLQSSEDPTVLGDDLGHFAVIALQFPKFRDGRAFSWARKLRTRLGYTGEIRAVGDFLLDQMNYQHRVGFDAWEVPDHFTVEMFNAALVEMTNVYQPSSDGRKTIRELRAAR